MRATGSEERALGYLVCFKREQRTWETCCFHDGAPCAFSDRATADGCASSLLAPGVTATVVYPVLLSEGALARDGERARGKKKPPFARVTLLDWKEAGFLLLVPSRHGSGRCAVRAMGAEPMVFRTRDEAEGWREKIKERYGGEPEVWAIAAQRTDIEKAAVVAERGRTPEARP